MTLLIASLCLSVVPLDLKPLELAIQQGKFPKVTSLVVEHQGQIVYEKYFGEGGPERLNDTRSVTKTVTALVAGIALHNQGKKPGDLKVREILGAKPADDAWNGTTLSDLLTMSSPIAADDSDGKSPGNEDRMHEHDRWLEWALALPSKPVKRSPNGRYPFCYATANAVLAGQVLQKITKVPLDKFTNEKLLGPLEIKKHKFQYSKSGEVMSGGGLRLTTRDLCKLGQLILDEGQYKGKQVVPKAWIKDMTTPHHKNTVMPGVDYGYFLWTIPFGSGAERDTAWCMLGNGGNLVAVFLKRKAVVTLTRTDYNSDKTPAETMELVGKYILPQLK